MTNQHETRGSNLEILVNNKGDMLVLLSGKQVIGFPSYRPQESSQLGDEGKSRLRDPDYIRGVLNRLRYVGGSTDGQEIQGQGGLAVLLNDVELLGDEGKGKIAGSSTDSDDTSDAVQGTEEATKPTPDLLGS